MKTVAVLFLAVLIGCSAQQEQQPSRQEAPAQLERPSGSQPAAEQVLTGDLKKEFLGEWTGTSAGDRYSVSLTIFADGGVLNVVDRESKKTSHHEIESFDIDEEKKQLSHNNFGKTMIFAHLTGDRALQLTALVQLGDEFVSMAAPLKWQRSKERKTKSE